MGERVLPTARELAQVHVQFQLVELRRLAIELDDPEALDVIDRAIVERKRIELDAGLSVPEIVREREGQWLAGHGAMAAGILNASDYNALKNQQALTPLAGVGEARLGAGGSPPTSE